LLAVLIQHGDRKPKQQALHCEGPVDSTRGEVRVGDGNARTLLFEDSGSPACPRSAVTMVDVGATFGGAGRLSRESTATVNLTRSSPKNRFSGGRRPNTSHDVSSVDAWVSVFEDKVRQIEARTCQPAWR
jgi:hypothetical protein